LTGRVFCSAPTNSASRFDWSWSVVSVRIYASHLDQSPHPISGTVVSRAGEGG
jgi:hypothetical protein